MSVVNKMLKDLEARQSQSNEINADYHAPQKKQSKLLVLVLVLLILAIAAITFAVIDKSLPFNGNTVVTAPKNTESSPPATTAKKMTVLPKKQALQKQVQPQIASVEPSKSNLELVNTATDISLPSNVLTDQKVLSNEPKIISDNLTSLQNIETQDELLETPNNTYSSELDTQTKSEQTSSFSMSGSSQENNLSSLKQRIAESLNNNDLDLAQLLLHELLETEPENIKASKKLASLLFAQGDYVRSKLLLIRSIELHPAQSDLRLMLARLYVVQKDNVQAMNILAEIQPSADNQTEYLAYRASLAQQLKQTELAKSDYKTLTKIESTNAKWWLGLAIAEDQLGEMNMAVQAYNRASALGQLDGSVNEFIQQRITVLAGTQ